MSTLKTILIGVVIFIITSLLGWIAISVKDVTQLKDDNKTKWEIYEQQRIQIISMLQNEIDKRHELEIEIVKLQTKLDQR